MTDTKKIELSPRDVVTSEVRLSFPALFTPKPRFRGSDSETYQAVLLLPPDTDMTPFDSALKAAMIEKFGKPIKLPAAKNPVKDCAEKGIQGYDEGWHYINLHSRQQPPVVDRRGVPVTDESMIYAGCWVRAYINAFAWDHPSGGKGVSFGLNAIQFVRDDDRLDGRATTTAVFEPLDDPEGSESPEGSDGDDLWG